MNRAVCLLLVYSPEGRRLIARCRTDYKRVCALRWAYEERGLLVTCLWL